MTKLTMLKPTTAIACTHTRPQTQRQQIEHGIRMWPESRNAGTDELTIGSAIRGTLSSRNTHWSLNPTCFLEINNRGSAHDTTRTQHNEHNTASLAFLHRWPRDT
jgi:hypothetical protein